MTLSILTCSPHFSDLALNEIAREHPSLHVLSELSPGCYLLNAQASFNKLTRPWRHRPPIYLHHLFPVNVSEPLQGDRTDLSNLQEIVTEQMQAKHPFVVQPRILSNAPGQSDDGLPYTVEEIIEIMSGNFPTQGGSEGSTAKRVLSVVIARTDGAWQAYLGASWPEQNLSPWPGGIRPYHIGLPNRAGYKLLEALDVFQIRLHFHGWALDLGAAPGAWTMVLRLHGMNVTAVSPDQMYDFFQQDPMVHHRQMTAQDYLAYAEGPFDFITNDMKMDARDSARLMVRYADHLRPQGLAIMTLKLYQQNRRRIMDHTYRLLRNAYKIIRVRQLVSNRKEVTLFLRRSE